MSGIGNAGVAISNLHDKANEVTAKTGADGKFTAEGTIPGDSYEVTVEGQTVVVTPNTNGEDIGTVTVAEGVNFKTSIVPDQSNVDMMFLISGKEYKFNIEVANMGTIDCTAATFSLDFPSGITVKNQPSSLILGTIEPGKKKTIPITISCNSLSSEYEYKKIDVAITDGIALKTWDDAVSIKFNRGSVKFTIYSQKDVSGIIIVPGAKAYSFLTTYSSGLYKTAVELPRYSNEEYLVVFSGASAETETAYSLGIDDTSVPDFDDFSATGIYEPDNTEGEATPLNYGGRITAYLHKNDIDYYTVELSH
jgi:hypothetical protein